MKEEVFQRKEDKTLWKIFAHSPKANPQQMDYFHLYSLATGEIVSELEFDLREKYVVVIK